MHALWIRRARLTLIAPFVLVALVPGVAQSSIEFLNRPAVQAPEDVQAGLRGHEESDEIDQEIERYFSNLRNRGATDLDAQRLESLFGGTSAAERSTEEEESPGAFRFQNNADGDASMESHRVVTGDTIWNISRRYGVETNSILENNPELKSRPLYIGEEVLISRAQQTRVAPVAQTRIHVVRRGDTISAIARRYGLKANVLKRMNGLRSDRIAIGQRLKVGAASGPPPGYKYEALFDWPLRGVITSGFGRRYNPFIRRATQFHKGVDIGAPMGAGFRASRDGVVIFSGRMGGYGNAIFLRHTNGFVSVYAHNMKNLVQAGDVVKKGQQIGLVGRTGSATGPHLHFEVRKWRDPINPLSALNMRELVRADQVAIRN